MSTVAVVAISGYFYYNSYFLIVLGVAASAPLLDLLSWRSQANIALQALQEAYQVSMNSDRSLTRR